HPACSVSQTVYVPGSRMKLYRPTGGPAVVSVCSCTTLPPVAVSNTWISQPMRPGSFGSFTPSWFRSLNFTPRLLPACRTQTFGVQFAADGNPETYGGTVGPATAQLSGKTFGYGGIAAPFTGNDAP